MDAPKDNGFRRAHCKVEDFFYVCVQGGEFRALMTGGWYPDAESAWIGYLMTSGGDWAEGNYAPSIVTQYFKELHRRGAKRCFFDVELVKADALLRRYAQYTKDVAGVRIYSIPTPYKRPADCADSAPGLPARLGVIDLIGAYESDSKISSAVLRDWLAFVFKDAYGDAEMPGTVEWEAHHKAIESELEILIGQISAHPEFQLVPIGTTKRA
jgi:hypothetical protein